MDAARKSTLMAYCRIDTLSPDDDLLLESFYTAALSYMEEAGAILPETGTPLRAQYDLCVNAMVLQDWDTRGAGIVGADVKDNPAFRRRLNQLKHRAPSGTLASGGTDA